MSENDGEKELVLGNRQLLGIFFVATLLCGVFFAMGYVVGGNSAKSATATTAADTAPAEASDGKREEPQPPRTAASDTQPLNNAAVETPGASVPAPESRFTDNGAAPSQQPPAAAPAAPARTPPVASLPTAKTSAPASPSVATGVFISVPEHGASYVQVAATGRPAADDLVKTLRKGGLPAILEESSKPDLFRVEVGPYRSSLTLAEAKTKLKDLGFEHLIINKQ